MRYKYGLTKKEYYIWLITKSLWGFLGVAFISLIVGVILFTLITGFLAFLIFPITMILVGYLWHEVWSMGKDFKMREVDYRNELLKQGKSITRYSVLSLFLFERRQLSYSPNLKLTELIFELCEEVTNIVPTEDEYNYKVTTRKGDFEFEFLDDEDDARPALIRSINGIEYRDKKLSGNLGFNPYVSVPLSLLLEMYVFKYRVAMNLNTSDSRMKNMSAVEKYNLEEIFKKNGK